MLTDSSFEKELNRMRTFVMLVFVVVLWESTPSQAFPQASSATSDALPPTFVTLLHDMWHWRTQESPEFASQVGINDNTAGRLDSFSKERFQNRKDHCIELLKRAKNTPVENLSFENQISLDIFIEQIENYIENFKYLSFFIPVTSLEGPQRHLQHLVSRQMTLESYNDFQKLLARYGEFPRQVDEILHIMQDNIDAGIMPYSISMDNVLEQFSFLNVSLVDSTFFSPFLQIPLNFPPEQRRTLRQQAQERISLDLLPAFAKLKTFLTDTYLKHTRPDPGINSVAGGDAYYSALLQFYTSTKLTLQEIHTLGVTEIGRLQSKLMQVALESDLSQNSTLQEILTEMRESKHYYFLTKEELLEAFQSAVHDKLKNSLPSSFKRLPLNNLTIDGDSSEKITKIRAVWYEGPSLDGSRSAVFHIDTQYLNLISKYEVTPISLHFSYPGQHLHAVYLQTSSAVPSFRKVVDASHWNLAPAEFSHNPAFVEGWALYSEFLGEEMGVYDVPLKRLFGVARELSMAAMLSVDTGIHAMGWSVEKARNFLIENTALSTTLIDNAIKRIVTWPGRSCSAKVGEIKLKELRQRTENALGTSFNLEEFHDVLLKCTSSLNVVQKCVTHFITEKINMHEQSSSVENDGESEVKNEDEPENENDIGTQVASASTRYTYTFQYILAVLLTSQYSFIVTYILLCRTS